VSVSAIILAAGASRRMGTQKLLLPFAGKTVIEHVVDQVKGAGVADVVAVAGADRAVADVVRGRNVRVVVNGNPDEGMLGSVRCGVRSVSERTEAVLVVLGDQPSISAMLLRAMMAAWEASPRRILVPTFEGRRGHPLMFSLAYRDEVLTRYDEGGLRGLLRTHAGDVLEVPADDPSVLADMDDLEDYRRELKRHAEGGL
jgi:molybdenum cofactor cytidylyltransferase